MSFQIFQHETDSSPRASENVVIPDHRLRPIIIIIICSLTRPSNDRISAPAVGARRLLPTAELISWRKRRHRDVSAYKVISAYRRKKTGQKAISPTSSTELPKHSKGGPRGFTFRWPFVGILVVRAIWARDDSSCRFAHLG